MVGAQPGHVVALRNLAYVDRLHGHPARALRRYQQANLLLLALGNPDPILQAGLLRSIGSLHLERDEPAAALPYLERAETITRAAGSVRATTMVLYRLGELHLAQDEPDRADKVFTEALENVRTHIHSVRGEADALYGLGLVRLRQGEDVEALSLLEEALVIARDVDEHLIEARVLLAMAEHHQTRHNPNLAITVLIDAFAVLRQLRAPLWLARTAQALSDIYRSIGDLENASRWRNPVCAEGGRP
jgi:tetratricopeptide (TPR) repeat protein